MRCWAALGVAIAVAAHATAVSGDVVPPAEWQHDIDAADMVFYGQPMDPSFAPNIGNGFLALRLGPPVVDPPLAASSAAPVGDPQHYMGGMHMAGVFNGMSNSSTVGPSHRAHIPAVHNVAVAGVSPQQYVGTGLHLRHGIVYNRTRLPACGGNVTLTFLAHGRHRHALVTLVTWQPAPGTAATATCDVPVQHWGVARNATPDMNITDVTPAGRASPTVWAGHTVIPELPGISNATHVGLAFDAVPDVVTLAAGGSPARFLAVARSSLEDLGGVSPADAAVAAYRALAAVSTATLLADHVAAWEELWAGGYEVGGNTTVAAAVNASMYYILSSVRQDWPYALSPGGLAIDAYDGSTFWDMETWMLPPVALVNAPLALSFLQYREGHRLAAAKQRAADLGLPGANYPWQSAVTGVDVTVYPNPEGRYEQHITGDIVSAYRLMWQLGGNATWLANHAWPVVSAACEFWAARFTPVPPGVPGAGNYTVLNVQPPDESAGVVNSSAYTNAVAAASLKFCVDVARVLNHSAPPAWSAIPQAVYLPVSTQLFAGGAVHPEYDGYSGADINQADVALLQYPLSWPMSTPLKRNDLLYYEARTRQNGFYTGNGAYAIAWLRLGNRTAGDAQWASGLAHIDTQRFYVWKEELSGGHLNFITGAGTFLQAFVAGYAGVDVQDSAMVVTPLLPPNNVTSVRLRRVEYRGVAWSLLYDADTMSFEAVTSTPGAKLCVNGTQLVVGKALVLKRGTAVVTGCT